MMKARALLFALFASLLGFAPAHAQTPPFKTPAVWTEAAAPFRIIGDVYYVGTEGLGAYLIKTKAGAILLDGGVPESAPLIERNIEALGLRLSDVKILLNSHAHFDHSGGLAQLKRDTGATLAASAGDKPLLEGGYYPGEETSKALSFPPVKVDRVLRDGETVSLGAATLTAHVTPGHTPGCTTWTLPVVEGGKTHKIVFFCSASVAANRLVGKPTYPGIVADYEKTFAIARKIDADVFLAPHGEFFGMKEKRAQIAPGKTNPFVKPGEFAAFVDKAEADFKTQLASQQAALAKPAEKKP